MQSITKMGDSHPESESSLEPTPFLAFLESELELDSSIFYKDNHNQNGNYDFCLVHELRQRGIIQFQCIALCAL